MALPELFGSSYLLHHRLAVGSTSEVFLAQTTGEFARLCVIKRIRPELHGLAEFEERFRRDATMLVRLAHGNVAQVLEVGSVDGQPFVAMEQIDGVDLPELVVDCANQGPLPAELALHVAIEMCEGVSHLLLRRREEAGGLTYSFDTAWPLEVMLSYDGVVKIVDLGSFGALRLGMQSVTRIFNSPGYAAPEVILKRPLDVRSDIFALGLVLWECLAGARLVADDPEGYVRQVLAGRWRAPLISRKDVAGDVIRLAAECLELDPDKRPDDLEQVRRRLVNVLRRVAPAYGSAALSRLLWRRCGAMISDAEARTSRVARQAPTLETPPPVPSVHTDTYGKAGPSDRASVPEPAPLAVGDRIPGTRYRLVRPLGRGGSAEVFAGQHVDLERQVAIKILSPKLAESSEAIAQFRLEARACSRVSHPNIVDVIDFGELDDGRFFFAMELVEGRSLAEVLADQQVLAPGRAIGIFRQIAKALHAAHGHGIIHRDIKPENVMLVRHHDGREDFVKLLDFGVMAFAGDSASARMGTPGYMPPEQVRGQAPTPAMDIYAAGSTLYEALCGSTPYPYNPIEAFIQAQSKSPPPALRSHEMARQVPPALERVVHRTLERDPRARHGSVEELEADLLTAQREAGLVSHWDDLPAPADEDRPGARRATGETRREGRGSLLVAGAALAAAAVIAVVITVLVSGGSPTTDEVVPPAPAVAHETKTARAAPAPEADSAAAASLLAAAEQAVSAGHFTHPEGTSALDLLEKLWQVDPANAKGKLLRRRVVDVLAGAGDRLKAAGMGSSAQTLYHEALLFAPDSERLRTAVEPAARKQASARRRPAAPAARLAWLVAAIQQAISEGRFVSPSQRSALHYLVQLKRLDPSGARSGTIARRMSRTLRQEADRHWSAGKRERAKQVYRVIALLHPEDVLARQRAVAAAEDVGAGKSTPAPAQAQAQAQAQASRRRARDLVSEGQGLLRQGKLGHARERFLAAVRADAREPRAVTGLANVAFEEARYAQTVELAERAVALDKGQIKAHLLLGAAHFKLLRYADAQRAWRRALRIDPQNRVASRRLEMLKSKQRSAQN